MKISSNEKSAKCEICDGISGSVKEVKFPSLPLSLRFILEAEPPGAYIVSRESIKFHIEFDPLAFYVAMDESSQLFTDYLALAIPKMSPFKNIFDKK